MGISITTKKIGVLSLKMNELQRFKNLDLEKQESRGEERRAVLLRTQASSHLKSMTAGPIVNCVVKKLVVSSIGFWVIMIYLVGQHLNVFIVIVCIKSVSRAKSVSLIKCVSLEKKYFSRIIDKRVFIPTKSVHSIFFIRTSL